MIQNFTEIKIVINFENNIIIKKPLIFTFRSIIGNELKRISCLFKKKSSCEECIINQTCPYSFYFESPEFDRGNKKPHPSTLSIDFKKGIEINEVLVKLILIGDKAISYFPYLYFSIMKECQKVPKLLQSIKYFVDTHSNIKGGFLLTGSANLLNLKKTPDPLAGRLIELILFTFSSKEKNKKIEENVVDLLFSIFENNISSLKIENNSNEEHHKHIIEGGYPLSFLAENPEERALWFNSYISTFIERDIRTIGELRDLSNFIRFYNIIFPRSSGIINKSELSKLSKLNLETVENYLTLLENVYQIYILTLFLQMFQKDS